MKNHSIISNEGQSVVTKPVETIKKNHAVLFLCVLCVYYAVVVYAQLLDVELLWEDSYDYLLWGESFYETGMSLYPVARKMYPSFSAAGYSFLIALAYKVFGYREQLAAIISLLAATSLIPLTYILARRFFSRTVGLVAASLIFFCNIVYLGSLAPSTDNLATMISTVVLILLIKNFEEPSYRLSVIIGALMGLVISTRPGLAVLIPYFFIVLYLYKKYKGKLLSINHILVIFAVMTVVGLIFAVPLMIQSGEILFIKNYADAFIFDATSQVKRFQIQYAVHGDRSLHKVALKYPMPYLIANFLLLMFPSSIYAIGTKTTRYAIGAGILPFTGFFSLVGLYFLYRKKEFFTFYFFFLWAFVVHFFQSCFCTFATRYYLPIVPILYIFCAYAWEQLLEKVPKGWKWTKAPILGIGIVLFFSLSEFPGSMTPRWPKYFIPQNYQIPRSFKKIFGVIPDPSLSVLFDFRSIQIFNKTWAMPPNLLTADYLKKEIPTGTPVYIFQSQGIGNSQKRDLRIKYFQEAIKEARKVEHLYPLHIL